MEAIKCDLCGNFQECKRYDNVEFGTYETKTGEDWDAVEGWTICKSCKKKIKSFIIKMKTKSNKT